MELPFDSTRKKMSVIAKLKDDYKIFLMTKGADEVMISSLILSDETLAIVKSNLINK